ncbi:uncharacterized protein [Rutidosis leptorrhynchoides]|uniref:uncharacterized protein n=1 Tax=Rutidosis leptorrhynchoides TaxID=125765 RepID=UPI003A991AFC
MEKMGFGERRRKWIHACLKSTSISILVNGSPTCEFSIERGVQEGDPLSPFLFIIAAEGLNLLTKKAVCEGLQNFSNLMKLLNCFEKVSGLKINYHKSLIYGLGVPSSEIGHMALRFGCKVGEFPFTYVGLPIGKNMNPVENWNPVIDKFNARLANWKAKTITFGERKKFWAGSGESSKLISIKCEDSLLPYGEGGLNIGSLRAKNLALLGKWIWRAKTEPNSLWVNVIKSIHGSNELLFPLDPNGSQGKRGVWVNILRAGIDIEKCAINFSSSFKKQIGSGAEADQQVSVQERIRWTGDSWQATWNWKRELFGRADG